MNELVVGDEVILYTPDWPPDLGFTPSFGSLLIYGADEDDAWFLTRGESSGGELEGCYLMPASGVYDDGTHLIFTWTDDQGIRLPKGDDLVLPPLDDPETGRYPSSPASHYCLEEDGTVSATDWP